MQVGQIKGVWEDKAGGESELPVQRVGEAKKHAGKTRSEVGCLITRMRQMEGVVVVVQTCGRVRSLHRGWPGCRHASEMTSLAWWW